MGEKDWQGGWCGTALGEVGISPPSADAVSFSVGLLGRKNQFRIAWGFCIKFKICTLSHISCDVKVSDVVI